MRRQPGDLRDMIRTELFDELRALLRASLIRVEHRVVERIAGLIGHDKGLAEAGDADARDVRVLGRHLPDHAVDALHHGGNVDLVPAHGPANRVIPVSLAELCAVFVKYRQLAAGGADIKSSDFHFSQSLSISTQS